MQVNKNENSNTEDEEEIAHEYYHSLWWNSIFRSKRFLQFMIYFQQSFPFDSREKLVEMMCKWKKSTHTKGKIDNKSQTTRNMTSKKVNIGLSL